MSNFEVWEADVNKGPVTRLVWFRGRDAQDLPRRLLPHLQALSVEDVELDRVIVGHRWQALLYSRVQSPPLVLRITGGGHGKLVELTEGMRLHAFLARLAMEGETKELVDELLEDIWHERDFASNANAEIVDGNEA